MKRILSALSLFLLFLPAALHAQQYKVTGTIPIPGDWGWDYLLADGANRLLYVSHGTQVELLDLDSEKAAMRLPSMPPAARWRARFRWAASRSSPSPTRRAMSSPTSRTRARL